MAKEYITLSYDPGRADGPWFMSTGLTKPPKGKDKYDPIKVDKGDLGVLIFRIETKGIDFADPAIELKLAPGQPEPAILDQFRPQFEKDKKTGKDQKDILIVTDLNRDAEPKEYYYKLNFNNDTSLDPIIQNGCCRLPLTDTGGNMSMVADSSALNALAVAALLIFLAAARRRWARP